MNAFVEVSIFKYAHRIFITSEKFQRNFKLNCVIVIPIEQGSSELRKTGIG